MQIKYILLVAIFFYCANAQTTVAPQLKEELLSRATILDNRIKGEIKRLTDEKNEHLAQLLQEEEKRLETLTTELKAVTSSDAVRLAVLENELIRTEFRVERELNNLRRERATQDLLLSNAKILKEWTKEDIKNLTALNTDQSLAIARELEREVQRLDQIINQLATAQAEREIERLEVEIRVIEVRLSESLRRLNFKELAATTATTLATTRVTPVPTTLSATQIRDLLLKRATQLEKNVAQEIGKLKKENRTAQAAPLEQLEAEVKVVVSRLTKFQQADILALLESELYWLERRLDIELQALVAQDQRVQRLLAISAALKQRIVSVEKVLSQTPVGAALQEESKKLDDVTAKLKVAKEVKSIDSLELELALIEKRVNNELGVFVNPTTKAF